MQSFHNTQELGMMIRQERKARGWLQTELAQKSSISRKTLIDLEAGKNVGIHYMMNVLTSLNLQLSLTPKGQIPFELLEDYFKDETS